MYDSLLGGKIIELNNHGHYTLDDMGTNEFPELLKEINENPTRPGLRGAVELPPLNVSDYAPGGSSMHASLLGHRESAIASSPCLATISTSWLTANWPFFM